MKRGLSLRWKILAWFFVNLALIGGGIFVFLRAQFSVGIESLLAGPTGARLDAIALPLLTEMQSTGPSEWPAALDRAVSEWRARGVKASIFRNDGVFAAGDFRELPADVRALLAAHDAKMRSPGFIRRRPPGDRAETSSGRSDTQRREPSSDRPSGSVPTWRDGPFFLQWKDEPGQRGRGPRGEPFASERREGSPAASETFIGPPAPPDILQARPANNLPNRLEKFMLTAGEPRLYWAGVHLENASGRFPMTLFLASDSLRGGGLFFEYVPLLWLGGAILLGSALLWLPFVHGLTSTVRRLTRSAEMIAEGNFETPAETSRSDELGRLHNAHRHMAQRLDGYVTGQKRFLGDTAHELLSPLARLEVALSILEQHATEGDRAYTERALGEVRHMSTLVQELLTFSKSALAGPAVKLEPIALASLARDAAQREGGDAQIEIAISEEMRVLGVPVLLARAVGNVVRNAVRYAGSPIRITAELRDGRVHLTISDQGPGVPADSIPRIFDPFFRPDTSRTSDTGGTGLGLAIVKTCVEASGGTVSARNGTPRGFEIEIVLKPA
jgi:two-component system, OmpR family, sensor histidine kinase CpxA